MFIQPFSVAGPTVLMLGRQGSALRVHNFANGPEVECLTVPTDARGIPLRGLLPYGLAQYRRDNLVIILLGRLPLGERFYAKDRFAMEPTMSLAVVPGGRCTNVSLPLTFGEPWSIACVGDTIYLSTISSDPRNWHVSGRGLLAFDLATRAFAPAAECLRLSSKVRVRLDKLFAEMQSPHLFAMGDGLAIVDVMTAKAALIANGVYKQKALKAGASLVAGPLGDDGIVLLEYTSGRAIVSRLVFDGTDEVLMPSRAVRWSCPAAAAWLLDGTILLRDDEYNIVVECTDGTVSGPLQLDYAKIEVGWLHNAVSCQIHSPND